jgi:hypothetical protein
MADGILVAKVIRELPLERPQKTRDGNVILDVKRQDSEGGNMKLTWD